MHATIPKGIVGGFEFAVLQRNLKEWHKRPRTNLVPRVFSYPPHGAREKETLLNAGHMSPRIWEITNTRFGGGAGKCEICPYRS